MWQAIVDFIFDSEYMLQLIVAEILCTLGFRRRKYFIVSAIAGIIVSVAFYYGLMYTIPYFSLFGFNSVLNRALWGWRWLLSLVVTALFLKLCFKESWWSILFVTSAAQASQHFGHRLRNLFMTASGIDTTPLNYLLCGLGVFAVVYAALYFLFFRELNKKQIPNLNNTKLIFTVTACVILCLFIGVHSVFDDTFTQCLFDIAMILLCFFILCYQFGFLGESLRSAELKNLEWLLKETQKQYAVRSENIDLINVKCHDIRKQVRDMAGRIQLSREYAKEITDIVQIYDSTIDTKNRTLDTILTDKSLYCEAHGIKLNCIIDGEKLSFIDPADLYALFCNLLDNAIEAVLKLPEREKAIISLKVTSSGEAVVIHCANYFTGKLEFEDGLPGTSKGDTRYHGYGIKSMRFVAYKYGGNVTILPQDDVFNINIAIPLPQNS